MEVYWKGVMGGFTVRACELRRCAKGEGGGGGGGHGGEEGSGGVDIAGKDGSVENSEGNAKGNGAGTKGDKDQDKPDEELYLVYELGTYAIFGVWDDVKVAYEEAERMGGLMMPIGFYH